MYEENELYAKQPIIANGVAKKSEEPANSKISKTEKEENLQPIGMAVNNVNHDSNNSLTDNKYSIVIKDATAKWSENSNEDSLNNVSINIGRGGLMAIIGPVGAGKVRS